MDLKDSEIEGLSERSARAAWSGIAEPADHRVGLLIETFGAVQSLLWATRSYSDPGVGELGAWRLVHERVHLRASQIELDDELRRVEDLGGRIIVPSDSEWPSRLDCLSVGMPHALWVLGNLPAEAQESIAIVGARASTAYGNAIATDFAFDLAAAGCAVISGGAYGIDAAAHRGAMRGANKSESKESDGIIESCPTVAVLCGGLNNLYPAGNHSMFEQILAGGGALVSEMPPSFRPARWRFIERNRIIAALADATLIVEASSRSGAIATANRAVELGREVGAVPGPITSAASVGSNRLISDGATLISSVSEVFTMIGSGFNVPTDAGGYQGLLFPERTSTGQKTPRALTRTDPMQRRTWDALPSSGSMTPEVLASEAGLAIHEIRSGLLGLRALGLVIRSDAGHWSRVYPA